MKKRKLVPLLGVHISTVGGIENVFKTAERIGCNTIQLFTKSNRRWSFDEIESETARKFIENQKNSSIQVVISHASYLINVASQDKVTEEKSLKALEVELKRCNQLKIPYLVLHPGACLTSPEKDCLKKISKNLSKLLSNAPGKTILLIENVAGQGTTIGYSFEQLAIIRNSIDQKKRLGICFDTCHAFAAGYKFSTKKWYKETWKNFDSTIGLENLKVIHMNDSKRELGSRIDRHENIGEGKIGLKGFEFIMNDPHFSKIPKILETPKDKEFKNDMRNMKILKGMVKA